MQKYLMMIASLCLIVSYQNCQQATKFSGPVELSSKATEVLAPIQAEDDEDDQEEEQPGGAAQAEDDGASGESLYVCILKGDGRSVKLGMADAALAGQSQTPSVLCMSKKACEEIAAAKFEVVAAEKRGYCKDRGNPNTKHISDADMSIKCKMH